MRKSTIRLAGGLQLCLVMLLLALGSAPASQAASESRSYVGQIGGFNRPEAVTVAPNDDLWVSDIRTGQISHLSPYPQNELLGTIASSLWGSGRVVHSVSVSGQNGFVHVGIEPEEERSGATVINLTTSAIFDNYGALRSTAKTHNGSVFDAVNNAPQSETYGDYAEYGPGPVELFDGYGNPVDFTATAPYISGNKIIGSPSVPVNGVQGALAPTIRGVTFDDEGNLWVNSTEDIFEFSSTGLLINRISKKRAEVSVPVSNLNPTGPKKYGSGGTAGIAVDPITGNVLVADRASFTIDEFNPAGEYVGQLTGADLPQGGFGTECFVIVHEACLSWAFGLAFDSQGNLYVSDGLNRVVDVFGRRENVPTIAVEDETNPTLTGGTLNATVDPNDGGDIVSCKVVYGIPIEFERQEYTHEVPCSPDPSGGHFTTATQVHADLTGLETELVYHYRFKVANAAGVVQSSGDHLFTPHHVVGLSTDPATDISSSGATLRGSFVGTGSTTSYIFEYGLKASYGSQVPLPAGNAGAPTGPARTPVEAAASGLLPGTTYHYRVVAKNGSVSNGQDETFRTDALQPEVKSSTVDALHSTQARFTTKVNPGGSDTSYTVEYGEEPCSEDPDPCADAFHQTHIGSNAKVSSDAQVLDGLKAGTTYYYRVVATNSAGTTYGPDRHFGTFSYFPELKDTCSNALARQQTGAALLSDCRAYELVSSPHAGGYDVESTLVPGQTPFDGYPRAEDPVRVLYGVHSGAIPGVAGNPTNRGVDPYVATRGDDSWTTSYVGIPATNPSASAPFSSNLLEADPTLDAFAFGGQGICSPCFADGSTGVPIRRVGDEIEEGMHGSKTPPPPAEDDGLVKQRFSADGTHLVFSSTSKFEPEGNEETGDVSIYARDFATKTTEVVSTDPSGNPLACLQGAGTCHSPSNAAGIAELGLSSDGSKVVTGQLIETDADGNHYFHLYMHLEGSPDSVDLTPGATEGALFDGMTEDGSRVFLTTKDSLVGSDSDESADIYEVQVDGGTATPRLISTHEGTASNDDACTPPGTPGWNTVSGEGKCNAVAFAGGAGVAAGNGTFYFVSPELLDSGAEASGEPNQVNLYVVAPGGNPEFVATIDSGAGKTPPPPQPYRVEDPEFIGGVGAPEDLAVDQETGDIYFLEAFTTKITRWNPDGTPHPFSAVEPYLEGNAILEKGTSMGNAEGQIAIDNSGGPLDGTIYITNNSGWVEVYSRTGERIGEINNGFGYTCGAAVDESNGDLYVATYPSNVFRLRPISNGPTISAANYEAPTGIEAPDGHCNIDVSSDGHLLTWPYEFGEVTQRSMSAFGPEPFSNPAGTFISSGSKAKTDALTNDIYVNKGEEIAEFSPSGTPKNSFGAGLLSGSRSIAVNATTRHIYADSEQSHVVSFVSKVSPFSPIDNPAVVHAVKQAGTHSYGDFQVSPDGSYAVFATKQPLDQSYSNEGHQEIYRFDTSGKSLSCVSCAPTNAPATADARLAPNGLGLTDDGRVFFDSGEPLSLRDGNGLRDVYEWEEDGAGPEQGGCNEENANRFSNGVCLSLISTGTGRFDSGLLSATASGDDAFFFTHDTLVQSDENGPVTKIYDARTYGGTFHVPPPAECVASDECHGPGTRAAESPPIRTLGQEPGDVTPTPKKPCRKGFAKKHGKCVKKGKKAKQKHRKARGGNR